MQRLGEFRSHDNAAARNREHSRIDKGPSLQALRQASPGMGAIGKAIGRWVGGQRPSGGKMPLEPFPGELGDLIERAKFLE